LLIIYVSPQLPLRSESHWPAPVLDCQPGQGGGDLRQGQHGADPDSGATVQQLAGGAGHRPEAQLPQDAAL